MTISDSRDVPIRFAVVCGGPSGERGISLNSARSVLDHIGQHFPDLSLFYFDSHLNAYLISAEHAYSNTPDDFDFRLQSGEFASPLSAEEFVNEIRRHDLVFPVIHGAFGEDGGLPALLERAGIAYVGADPQGCINAFDKARAKSLISKAGLLTLPWIVVESDEIGKNENGGKSSTGLTHTALARIQAFFEQQRTERYIVKPSRGGSSFGVQVVSSADEAANAAAKIFSQGYYQTAIIEPLCTGTEFTVVVMQNVVGQPVALLPIEVEKPTGHEIFDYRLKYLPSTEVAYHCPPRFEVAVTEQIRSGGEQIFSLLGLRDYARIDGWLHNGEIYWSDFNPISGLEQNSFFFIQAARVGLSHRQALTLLVSSAANRSGLALLPGLGSIELEVAKRKQKVAVLFGGNTAERQVSVMSGTNVWLKLKSSDRFEPIPYLLDRDGTIFEVPYPFCLYHTVEEISAACRSALQREDASMELEIFKLREQLRCPSSGFSSLIPRPTSLEEIAANHDFVFLGLHGGAGEDGTIQLELERLGVAYNGSGPSSSELCMDKYALGLLVDRANLPGVSTAEKYLLDLNQLDNLSTSELWGMLQRKLSGPSVLVKPRADGCSCGVAVLHSVADLANYLTAIERQLEHIPPHTLTDQPNPIELPSSKSSQLLFERFVVTDRVAVRDGVLDWEHRSGWIELTVGILGSGRDLKALDPSLTVASAGILSLEEKFQGGTGINITPPPSEHINPQILELIKTRVAQVAVLAGVEGYARMDIFANATSGEIIVIEINTLPGLTPSTVLFQQALADRAFKRPVDFLEALIDLGMAARRERGDLQSPEAYNS